MTDDGVKTKRSLMRGVKSPASIISQDLPQSGPLPHGENTNLYCPYAFQRARIGRVCFRCEGMICDDDEDNEEDDDLSCVLPVVSS